MSHPDGIRCDECESFQHSVIKTVHRGGLTYRRRLCAACGARFTTFEKSARRAAPDRIDKAIVAGGIRQMIEDCGLGGHI